MSDTERLRDLTRRLGFGDGVTEPQADNDTIVRWVDERVAEASEWVESVRWQDECFAAGHEDPISCAEHEPVAAARADERERMESVLGRCLARVRHDHAWPMEFGPHDCPGCDLERDLRDALAQPADTKAADR